VSVGSYFGLVSAQGVRAPLLGACAPPKHASQAQHQKRCNHREKDNINELKTVAHTYRRWRVA
jgi:hypothetical protein